MHRDASGGTLILGGGFGGAHVARLLPTATIVSAENSMLFTPLLPEVAAGALEPRHAFVPLREMCPDAELLRGRVSALDRAARTVSVETEVGEVEVSYRRLVIALGSTARMLSIPARTVVASLGGATTPYAYRSIGEGATLGRGQGVARVFRLLVRGRLGALVTRSYHISSIPLRSRRVRVLTDGLLSVMLRRDIAELGSLEARRVST